MRFIYKVFVISFFPILRIAAQTSPFQPNPLTGVDLNSDGSFAVACTSTQWFFRNGLSTAIWQLGDSVNLSGMVSIGVSSDSKGLTFAGNDGFKTFYDSIPFSTRFRTINSLPSPTFISSANVNSLSVSGAALVSYQIMGNLDGGLWVSTANCNSFVKYVRVGANSDSGQLIVPIGVVSSFGGSKMGALGLLYQNGYSFAGTQFNIISSLPSQGSYLTSLSITSDTWYATFHPNSSNGALQKSVLDGPWETVANSTAFPTAQSVSVAGSSGQWIFVCSTDQVWLSSDFGSTFHLQSPHYDYSLKIWTTFIPDTPLLGSIAYAGSGTTVEVIFITRLGLYSATCNPSCSWTNVSIMTSTASFLTKETGNGYTLKGHEKEDNEIKINLLNSIK